MRKFLALLHLDYKRIIGQLAKLALVLSAFFVAIALIFALSDKKLDIDTNIALVMREQSVEVRTLIKNITSNKLEGIIDFKETDLIKAIKLLENNEVIAAIALPTDIMGSIYNREVVDIAIYSNNPQDIRVQFLNKYIDNLIFSLNEGQSAAMIYWDTMREQKIDREERIQSFNSLALTYMTSFILRGNAFGEKYNIDKFLGRTFISYYFYAVLVVLMLSSTILFHSFLDDDIKKGRIERLLSSGYNIIQIYSSKIVGGVVFSSLAAVFLKIGFTLIFNSFSFRILFFFMINYILISSVIQTIIIAIYLYIKNEVLRDGVFIAFILVGAITGGLILPFQSLPNWLGELSKFNIFALSHNILMGEGGKWVFPLLYFAISIIAISRKHRARGVL
ncbi:MAG: ABC transporter permease [Alkaliphilus sp.]